VGGRRGIPPAITPQRVSLPTGGLNITFRRAATTTKGSRRRDSAALVCTVPSTSSFRGRDFPPRLPGTHRLFIPSNWRFLKTRIVALNPSKGRPPFDQRWSAATKIGRTAKGCFVNTTHRSLRTEAGTGLNLPPPRTTTPNARLDGKKTNLAGRGGEASTSTAPPQLHRRNAPESQALSGRTEKRKKGTRTTMGIRQQTPANSPRARPGPRSGCHDPALRLT